MTYDFYADEADKLQLLSFIFSKTDLQIFDAYSAYDEAVKEYKSIEDLTQVFDLKNDDGNGIHLMLWSPAFKEQPTFERITLNPKYVKGHTFRYAIRGWGLIQLYLRGIKDQQLNYSHVGHINHKGALARETANSINGTVNDWDWAAVQSVSGKLKYFLDKQLSVKRIGSTGVLPAAEELQIQGIKLV